jgi:hypothetical protein
MVGSFALAAICHHIKKLSDMLVSGLRWPQFDQDQETQE